jgi:hypothetical protein
MTVAPEAEVAATAPISATGASVAAR